jgi:hypothetical protein
MVSIHGPDDDGVDGIDEGRRVLLRRSVAATSALGCPPCIRQRTRPRVGFDRSSRPDWTFQQSPDRVDYANPAQSRLLRITLQSGSRVGQAGVRFLYIAQLLGRAQPSLAYVQSVHVADRQRLNSALGWSSRFDATEAAGQPLPGTSAEGAATHRGQGAATHRGR